MKLTENFSLEEMTFSPTAIRKGISNKPSQEHIDNLRILCEKVLQPLRDHMNCTINVSSGYRAQALNFLIGGSKTSQHCFGQAADLQLEGRNHEMFDFIKENLEFDQLIWEFGTDAEPAWVHVSFNAKHNRKHIIKAIKVNGKTQYVRV